MARSIIIVNATQLVTSESHPEGILSIASGFPVTIDSSNSPYNGDIESAMKAAKATYFKKLEMATGEQILKEKIGNYPVDPEE